MIKTNCYYADEEEYICNHTEICTVKECDLHSSNYNNVFDEAIRKIQSGLDLLKELRNG